MFMNNPIINKYQPLDDDTEVIHEDDRNVELQRQIDNVEKKKKNIALFSILVIFSMILWSGLSYDSAEIDIISVGGHHHHHSPFPVIPPPSERCDPGILHNITSQMPFKIWNSEKGPLPYYSYADIDEKNQQQFENVVIIAHGFGRNANEYFCSGVNALLKAQNGDQSMNSGNRFISNTLIITAQFLSPGDVCWDKDGMYIYVYAR